MWETETGRELHLSHDLPCTQCGHAAHSYLPCSDSCACPQSVMPGSTRRTDLAA